MIDSNLFLGNFMNSSTDYGSPLLYTFLWLGQFIYFHIWRGKIVYIKSLCLMTVVG